MPRGQFKGFWLHPLGASKVSQLHITTEDGIKTVVIDNPPANIWTVGVIGEMNSFFYSLKQDRETKAIVFKSANPLFFVAHLDLKTINGTPEGQEGICAFAEMINNVKSLPQLSIAIVDGIARGGGNEFAMACDITYGTENAVFAQPEIGVNIPTGGQGGVQFARRLGRKKAMQFLLTGEDIPALKAEALNIITKYVPKMELDEYLEEFLNTLKARDLRDIAMYKDIVNASIRDEEAGATIELRHFLERAAEEKTQTIITTFLKSGGQTEREATDFAGLFADTAAELANSSK
ncbi:enoyl-CoA hydratase/isomerase family protein [Pelagibius sp. Alg239-R121]|uniref:enoyl-CoA hydratase/isomerase family protein n=1 Tax=Pelagibius sp. Alg239-R121 TaxID=2993448 RepID=UPI0024A7A4B0|nr:enoyl-CoA hydratase/isomerase family protein [Pelagibius sp. Alg239-R121]